MIDTEYFWEPDPEAQRGLTPADLAKAEKRLKHAIPTALVEVLKLQNGGFLRDESVQILPLTANAKSSSIDFADKLLNDELLEVVREEVGEPGEVLIFADEEHGHSLFGLDYNASGPQGEPEVIVVDVHCGYCENFHETCEEFLTRLTLTESEPSIDWKEADQFELLLEEKFDIQPAQYEGTVTVQQKLCDSATSYVLFCRETDGDWQLLSRCEIIKPLDAERCLITGPQEEGEPYQLALAPESIDLEVEQGESETTEYEEVKILWAESRETSERTWKNRVSSGHPESALLASFSRERLEQLRLRILGAELNERAKAQEEWQERLMTMSDDEVREAFPVMMRSMLSQAMEQLEGVDPEDVPSWMRSILAQARELEAHLPPPSDEDAPLNPDLQRLMEQVLGEEPEDPSSKN